MEKKKIMGLLSWFGFGNKRKKIKEFMDKNAVIIDVRTVGEFQSGHIKNSKNIPLNTISSKIESIKSLNKPVIVCCQSGIRSSQANSILKNNGIESMNGGGWMGLRDKL